MLLISTGLSFVCRRGQPGNTSEVKYGLNYEKMKLFKEVLDFKISYLFLHPLLKNKGTYKDDSVAQQVEHIPFKDGVLGSNPSWFTSTK